MGRKNNKDYAIEQYFEDIKGYSKLPAARELELIKLAQSGDADALNQVVMSNAKLVTKLAGDYDNDKIAYLDLVQEGNIALMNAVKKYDTKSNSKFSAYAGQAINTAFRDLFDKEYKTIRLPANICRLVTKVNKYKAAYLQDYENEPSDEELVEYSNGGLKIEDVETVRAYSYKVKSLDEPMFDDIDDSQYSEYVSNDKGNRKPSALSEALGELPLNELEAIDFKFDITCDHSGQRNIYSKEDVEKAINHLKKILKERYGMDIDDIGLGE